MGRFVEERELENKKTMDTKEIASYTESGFESFTVLVKNLSNGFGDGFGNIKGCGDGSGYSDGSGNNDGKGYGEGEGKGYGRKEGCGYG